ncbi:MAG: peptidase M15 [Chloroflexi bacterium]|nr:MAG: peptidase M15 [Chloroflexota bacterium]
MRLSPHFTLQEFTISECAARAGIDNRVPHELLRNVISLALTLERVRTVLGGVPLIITSGYRCPQLNKLIRGRKTSAHLRGLAADFIAPSFGSHDKIVQRLSAEQSLTWDQLILEYSWVHLSIEGTRRQVLTEP